MRCRYKYFVCFKTDRGYATTVVGASKKLMGFESLAREFKARNGHDQVCVMSYQLISRI